MNLHMERQYKVVFGEVSLFRILLVGVGGTGSALALALAGLMHHARQKGIRIELTLVDDDKIEDKNIGRQEFGVASSLMGGVYKCSDMALRMNAAYGLDMVAWPECYAADLGTAWVKHGRDRVHLIIGCVDNHLGRQEIAKTVAQFNGRVWALDSGNAEFNGQVLIGNTTDVGSIQFDRLGLCTGLPSPYLQEPRLLQPEEVAQPLSCAEMAQREEQSLMVNRFAAAIAAQYVANMALSRQIVQMGTAFNLKPTVMAPRFATRETVAACLPASEIR